MLTALVFLLAADAKKASQQQSAEPTPAATDQASVSSATGSKGPYSALMSVMDKAKKLKFWELLKKSAQHDHALASKLRRALS